jgi:Spy/CpxP family protein refolding chaperone
MNKTVKIALAGMVITALSASVYARGGEDCEYGYGHGYGYGMHGGEMGMHPERMEKMREQHLASLHDKLKLTAKQEAAWKKFAASKPMLDKSARLDPAEMEKLNAPQRLEKGLEHMRTMEARMTEHLAALKEFYAVLTPEQQKVFDEEASPRRWHEQKKGK